MTQGNDLHPSRPAPAPIGNPDDQITVTMTLSRERMGKLQAWMASDVYEKAMAVRDGDIKQGVESLIAILKWVRQHRANSSRGMAAVICSWYNGDRVKADMSALWAIDQHWAEHVMNVMRLMLTTRREPHTFIKDGQRIIEEIIRDYRLEKRRRKA